MVFRNEEGYLKKWVIPAITVIGVLFSAGMVFGGMEISIKNLPTKDYVSATYVSKIEFEERGKLRAEQIAVLSACADDLKKKTETMDDKLDTINLGLTQVQAMLRAQNRVMSEKMGGRNEDNH